MYWPSTQIFCGCVFFLCVCVWRESRELMRQACGGPPALSQINHAADPVPSAWGPNRACMLSLSHGPGPLSSPQHNSSGVEGGGGGGWGWYAPERLDLLPFLSSFSFCGHQDIDAGRENRSVRLIFHLPQRQQRPLFIAYRRALSAMARLWRGGGGGGSVCQGPGNNSPTSLCIGKQPILVLHPLFLDWAPASICPHLLIG